MNRAAGSHVDREPEVHPIDADSYADWIRRIANGDADAFEMLFRSLYERLCVFAESFVGSSHAAEEIVDDVFLNLWKGRERLRVRTSVLSYLFVAVRNKALTYQRRHQLEHRYAERAEAEGMGEVVDGGREVEEQVANRELMALLQAAVRELPPRAQQTYLLYYQQHLSYAEIARIMGVTVKTVENQLARAVKILMFQLKERLA